MATRIQLRRGTAAQWAAADPILAEGEIGLELDTGNRKIGDGVQVWTALPYDLTEAVAVDLFAGKQATEDALDDKVPTTRTVAGKPLTGDVTLDKSDVGLGNVANIAPAALPISDATRAELDTIRDDASVGRLVTYLTGDGDTPQAATGDTDLTVSTEGTLTYADGPFVGSRAVVFGAGGRITFPNDHPINADEGSIEAWVYRESDPGGNQYFITAGKKATVGQDWVGLRVNSNDTLGLNWHAGGVGAEKVSSTGTTIPVGQWVYVYADWLGTEVRLGMGAGALSTGTRDAPAGGFRDSPRTAIGAYNMSVAGTFAGRIYGVRINRRRLTDAERAARAMATAPWELHPADSLPLVQDAVDAIAPGQPAEIVMGSTYGQVRVRHLYDVRAFGAIGNGLTDDEAAIEAAHAAAYANGGGVVWLGEGRYRIPNMIDDWKSNVSLIGAGIGKAVLVHEHPGFPCIANTHDYSVENPMRNVTFAGFELDASGVTPPASYGSSAKGIFVLYMKDVIFRDLYVHDTLATGLGVDFLVNAHFLNVIAENCGRHNDGTQPGGAGIGIATGASPDENTILDGVILIGNKRYGAFFEQASQFPTVFSSYMKIVNSHAAENGYGFVDAGVSRMIVESSSSVRNIHSGYAANRGTIAPNAGHENTLINVDLHNNGEHGVHIDYRGNEGVGRYHLKEVRARGNAGDGLRVDIGTNDVPDLWIEGGDYSGNDGYGIRETSTGGELVNSDVARNRVTGNTLGSINIPDAGPGTLIRENRGHATEATGTSAIPDGATEVDVPHGMVAIPGNVIATPRGPEPVWVSARDADSFTLSRSGSSGVLTVDWAATTASG